MWGESTCDKGPATSKIVSCYDVTIYTECWYSSSHGLCTLVALCCTSWWRHQMETFSVLLAVCAGNSPVPVNSTHKGQWRGDFIFSMISAWINGWVNNREAGDLGRYRTYYDVIVMSCHDSVRVHFIDILYDTALNVHSCSKVMGFFFAMSKSGS